MTPTPPPKQSQKSINLPVINMQSPSRTNLLTAIAMILAAGISVKATIGFSANSGQTNSSQAVELAQQPILPGMYERVELDMAIVEVQAILGPGIEISSSKTTKIYQWRDSNGNCITAAFEEDFLQEKDRQCSYLAGE